MKTNWKALIVVWVACAYGCGTRPADPAPLTEPVGTATPTEPTLPGPTTPGTTATPIDTGDPLPPLPDGLTTWDTRLWLTPLIVRADVVGHAPISLDAGVHRTVETLRVLEVIKEREGRGVAAGTELSVLLRIADPVEAQDGDVVLRPHVDPEARLGAEVVVHLFPMSSPVHDATTWWTRMFGPPDDRGLLGVFVKSTYDEGDFVASSSGLKLLQAEDLDHHVWLQSLDAADDERDDNGIPRAPSRLTEDAIGWDAYLSELRARVGGLP